MQEPVIAVSEALTYSHMAATAAWRDYLTGA